MARPVFERWFGTDGVDAMHKAWSGEANLACSKHSKHPYERSRLENRPHCGARFRSASGCRLNAFEGEVQWQCTLFPESRSKKMGGDRQKSLEEIPTDFSFVNPGSVVFKAPKNPGAYRVFVKACRDGTIVRRPMSLFWCENDTLRKFHDHDSVFLIYPCAHSVHDGLRSGHVSQVRSAFEIPNH